MIRIYSDYIHSNVLSPKEPKCSDQTYAGYGPMCNNQTYAGYGLIHHSMGARSRTSTIKRRAFQIVSLHVIMLTRVHPLLEQLGLLRVTDAVTAF